MLADNTKLVAELRRRAGLPDEAPDRAFLIGIRHLLTQAADAIDGAEARIAAVQTVVDDFADVTDSLNASEVREALTGEK